MLTVQFSSRLVLTGLALAAAFFQWPTTTFSWFLLASWPFGALLFLYISRVYLAPYVLMRFSSHIRVRSVSLRSIRGLYFRKGNRTWRIDRFVYSYRSSTDDGPRRLCFRIEGFTLDIEPPPVPHPPPPRRTHRRGLTLADLSPSPLALHLWSLLSSLYVVFDPVVRPVIRLVVNAVLQQVIRFIPRLMETVQVDIDRAVVSYVGFPQLQLVVQKVTFESHVSFAQSPQLPPIRTRVPSSSQVLSARALAMGAWKSRLSHGFQRAWTRTWNDTLGRMTGSISYDLVVREVHGFIPSDGLVQLGISESGTILHSPESFFITGSARFSPMDGTIEPCSIQNQIKVGDIRVNVDTLQRWLSHLKSVPENIPVSPPRSLNTTHSPWLKSPFNTVSSLVNVVSTNRTDFGKSFTVPDVRVAKRRKGSIKPLDLVASASLILDSVTVSRNIGCHKYNVVFKALACSCEPSNGSANPAHCAWLGKSSSRSRAFLFRARLQSVLLHRLSGVAESNPPILSIGSTSVDATLSDWPSILSADPSPSCDINTPSVFLDVHISTLSFADRLTASFDLIMELNSLKSPPSKARETHLPTLISPVPWTAVNLGVGSISARVICADVPGVQEPFSVELETEGIVFTSSSSFCIGVMTTQHLSPDGELPFHMTCPFSFHLRPVFLRLRPHSSTSAIRRMSRWGSECTSNDTLLSIEAVEATGMLTGVGVSNDDGQVVRTTLNTQTMYADLHCYTEASMVELWHPERLRLLSILLSLLSARWPSSRAKNTHSSSAPKLVGCSVSFSVARFVLFVTGCDINPNADKDITRGIAFSTGFSLRYCSINTEQRHAIPFSRSNSRNRAELCLPADRVDDGLLERISILLTQM
ncbi:hypothetical protein JVU11DRAFT_1614 [Chiua virens]|nr:hypothetical protein JVU11DRAFT_1614 [Chiua virens]